MKPTRATTTVRWPAEWEPHEATWLTWPRRNGISFPGSFDSIPPYWTKLVELLSPHERVHIVVNDAAHGAEVQKHLSQSRKIHHKRVSIHQFGCNECWARDHGPIFVIHETASAKRKLVVLDWLYNAWGGKYPPWDFDDIIPRKAARALGLSALSPKMVLEGGSIDGNGRGTVLTTEQCLLNRNRNPKLTRAQIESKLRRYLGATNILWLGEGIAGDDTDGHIDDIARFVAPRTVVACVEDDPVDPNFRPLQDNVRRLRSMRDQDGRPLQVIELPMPGIVERKRQRLPASYANFYIANKIVLVPIYSHRNDRRALEILQKCFPSRRVVGIESTDLIWGLGAFHCLTQQQPCLRQQTRA